MDQPLVLIQNGACTLCKNNLGLLRKLHKLIKNLLTYQGILLRYPEIRHIHKYLNINI